MPRKDSCDNPQKPVDGSVEKPVSLAPLDLRTALSSLMSIPDPEATKPKNKKPMRHKE